MVAGPDPIHLHYLNHADVQALAMTDAEIVTAVESALRAQGLREVTIEPRMHLVPEKDYPGHFNVLRGYIRPLGMAGVKVVGDFYRNYERGLPSELALLNLFDPKTGRMREGIGHYVYEAAGDRKLKMTGHNPYPCEFDRGIIEAMAKRFKPAGAALVRVKHDDSAPCRKTGADSCTYWVEW